MAKDYPENVISAKASVPSPDVEHAAAFLESIAGGLPITVASIHPETRDVTGETFTLPEARGALCEWLAQREGRTNLYYSLNAAAGAAPRVGKGGRLREADVSHIRGVAVDLDPTPGAPLEAERARLFAEAGKANVFGSPTAIVDSGGGVQMLWLFPEPVPCTADTAAAVQAQARGLCAVYGSDAVHSLDHLFRLPSTRNLPDARKRERGRTVSVATVWSQSGERHDLSSLRNFAPPVAAAEKGNADALGIEYADVLDALGAPERLPKHLRAAAEDCVARLDEIVGDAADRSTRDHRTAAHLIRKHRMTDPTELACATFAVSPEKLEERDRQGSGEYYCSRTIAAALERNHPDPDPLDYFEAVTDEERAEAARLEDMFATQAEAKRPRIEVLKRSEIRKLRPPEFVIARHLPEASLGFLYGAPGSGKSFVAIDWAMHMATDREHWHGDKIAAKPGGWIVYLAREGATGLQTRLEAWEAVHTPFANEEARFALIRSAVDFMKPGDVTATVEAVLAAGLDTVSMIVVDTVSRSMPGADENLQKDMTTFVAACDALKDEFGCIVLGVHHASKGGEMRGSSVLLGAGDFVFRVKKAEGDAANAQTRRLNLFCEKMKDGADGWGADYWLERVGLGRKDASGEEIASLVPRRAPAVERSEDQARTAGAWAAIVLGALGDRNDAPWSELCDAVGEAARAQGLIRATSEQKVRDAAVEHLGRLGADVPGPDGQKVNVSLEQAARGKPWQARQIVVSEPDEGTNDREREGTK